MLPTSSDQEAKIGFRPSRHLFHSSCLVWGFLWLQVFCSPVRYLSWGPIVFLLAVAPRVSVSTCVGTLREDSQSVSQSISLSVCQSVFDFLFSVSVRVVIFPVLPAALERLVFLLPPVSFVSRASVWRGDWQVCIYWRSVKIPAASASLSSSSLLLSWTWQNAVKLHDSVLFPFLSFFNLFFVSSCLCLLVNTTLHTKHLPSPLLFFTEESH